MAKNRKWPSARNGEKMAQKWQNKNGIWGGHFSFFSPFLGHFFPISGRGPFSIFWPILPIFGFRPVSHSIPGGLTRNKSPILSDYFFARPLFRLPRYPPVPAPCSCLPRNPSASGTSNQLLLVDEAQLRKIRAPIKIKSALSPPPPQTPPPKKGEFYGHGFSCRKNAFFPGVHKIGAPISGPRIADTNFTDTRIFLNNLWGVGVGVGDATQTEEESPQNWRTKISQLPR